MIIKPKVIVTEDVITQIQKFESRKNNLELKLEKEKRRLEQVHQVLQENNLLEAKAKVLINEYLMIQTSTLQKNKEYYREIRLAIIQKALDFLSSSAGSTSGKEK
jgi:hypothetical protein